MEGKTHIQYAVYAIVNGQATHRHVADSPEDIKAILDNNVEDDISEELLYQETREEEYYG